MQYDTEGKGLEKVFKWYIVKLLKHLETTKGGLNSREAYEYLLKGDSSISRASVINGLNRLVDEGLLLYEEKTGKGGHHRVYFLEKNEQELKDWITEKIINDLRLFNPESKLL